VTAASAQSTVTISGLVRAGVQNDMTQTAANPALVKATAAAPGAAAAAVVAGKGVATTDININFAATEDLGGGLKASFFQNLETDPQRGAALTRADSGLSLAGGFGTIAYTNTRNSDQIASIGSSAINLPDGLYNNTGIVTRTDLDTLSYTSMPIIPGLNVSVTYVEANNGQINIPTTNTSAYVLGAAYTNGPLVVRAAFKMKPATLTASSGLKGKDNLELAVVYDLGMAKIGFAHDAASAEGTSTAAASTAASGGTLTAAQAQSLANLQTKAANGFSVHVPMGAVSFGLGMYSRGDQKVTDYGVRYDLSKRTNVTASGGKKSGLFVADGFGGTQYRVALAHSF
jgi:predicted porin